MCVCVWPRSLGGTSRWQWRWLIDRRQPKQAVAQPIRVTVGLEPAGLARCLRGKREPVASGASVYLPVFLSSALEQPVLLDGASWSCTRPSLRALPSPY